MVALGLLAPALAFWVLWLAPVGDVAADRAAMAARDFTALWAAGRLAVEGATTLLSDPAAFTGTLRDWFGPGFPEQIWPYSPVALLLAAPIGTLPLGAGFAAYTALSLAALAAALRIGGLSRLACLAVLLSPAVADNALAGQNGALTAAMLVGGLLLLDRRPVLAGVLFGAMSLKPQLALLLPVCLVAGQRWRVLGAAALTAAGLVLVSLLAFGESPWVDFLIRVQPTVAAHLETPWDGRPAQRIFISVFIAARAAGAGLPAAYEAQIAVTLGCAALAWRAWRRSGGDPALRVALTAALAMLASPWVHSYDMPALAVSVVMLSARVPTGYRALLAFAWIWPGALSVFNLPPALPALSIAGVAWLALRALSLSRPARPALAIAAGLAAVAWAALPAPARASDGRACDAAAAKAEATWNVPAGVLSAVGTVESGRTGGRLGAAPWPWTINAAGRGAFYANREEAIGAVLAVMERGYPYIDVGCFQIDLAYHPGLFRSLADAFDPERNADEAAHILAEERLRTGSWAAAVAHYHSATPSLGGPYLDRVRAALPTAKLRGADALLAAVLEPSGQPDTGLAPLPPTPAPLPRVVYLSAPALSARPPQIVRMPTSPAGAQSPRLRVGIAAVDVAHAPQSAPVRFGTTTKSSRYVRSLALLLPGDTR